MKRIRRHQFIIFTAIFVLAIASVSVAIDPPHTPDLSVTCASCHNPSITFTYATIDNTPWNEICWDCHDFGMSGSKLESDTHSAISTNDDANQKHWGGTWTNECRTCHDPHTNEQARAYQGAYPAGAWLYTGTIQSSTYNTITVSGSPWAADEWIGKTLHPKAGGNFFYMIIDNTSNKLVVAGTMWPFTRMPGGTFAVSYGKLIRKDFNTGRAIVNSGGVKFDSSPFRTVKFLNSAGPHSGATNGKDTELATDAICVVCHTRTRHMNVGVAKYGDSFDKYKVYSHYYSDSQSCWGTNCHNNSVKGFGASCLDCHGYAPTKPETLIDDDASKGPTGRTSPGAHELHYDERYYECSVCHEGGAPGADHNDEVNPRLQVGFNVFGNKGGEYTAPAFPNTDYSLVSGNVETTISAGVSMTCSGVYCHSTSQADGGSGPPTFATPAWDGPVVCGDCHKSDGVQGNASKMDSGSHSAHVGAGVECSHCHAGNTHVDSNVDVVSSLTYSLAGPPGNGYGTCATGGCHSSGLQWGSTACLTCHATAQGDRVAITPQFSANSHHVQGVAVTNSHCYQCHWEARSDGRINGEHHGGSVSPGEPVDLVVYGSGTRPTSYNDSTAVQFTADGTRAEIEKLNTHCLGCHSNGNNGVDIFNDDKSPNYYAWDTPKTSIDARYSQSTTVPWGKYSDNSRDTQTKAYSAHGKATSNQGGWDLNETWTNNRNGSVNVACFDCHNAHGSTVSGTTTSYANPDTSNGGMMKDTTDGEGGYPMAYKPQAGGSSGNHNAYNTGAGLCFDCHLTASSGTKPWGYQSTFGATQSIMGYFDTPYFGPGTSGAESRTVFKSGDEQGGHFGASSGLASAASYQIDGLCTPCHDPHGVSSSLGIANMPFAVPLLKGTWLTSPYKEDGPPANNSKGTARTDIGKEGIGYHRTPNVTQSDTRFAGLCLKCHQKDNLTDGTDEGTWKSIDRIHESVNGWKVGASNHRYSCSKCHAPHNSGLPRLMVTNCLDKNHKGRMKYNAAPPLFGRGWGEYNPAKDDADCYGDSASLGQCATFGDRGWGRGNFPGVYEQHTGELPITDPARISACHASENGSWDDQEWNNNVTRWYDDTIIITSGPAAGSFTGVGLDLRATITWTTDFLSTSYVDYGFTAAYGYTTGNATLVTNHSVVITGLTNHSTYHYRVRSAGGMGTETASGDYTFYISVPPSVPDLSVVSDAVCASSCPVNLGWGASTNPGGGGTVEYQVEVDTSNSFNTGSKQTSPWQTALSWSPTLATNNKWYWRVRSRDATVITAVSSWSTAENFLLWDGTPPEIPTLSWPYNGYSGQVGFPAGSNPLRWNTSAGAKEYYCEYWGASSGNSDWIPTMSFNPGDLADNYTYYWRVKARNPSGESGWSPTWSWFDFWPASCPFIYAWDGDKYQYVTDIQGSAIGYPPGFYLAKYVTMFRPMYIVLNSLSPDGLGNYSIKLRETLMEISYVDEVKLLAVDHPEGYDVVSSSAEGTYRHGYVDPFKLYTIKDPRPPISAEDNTGADILASLLEVDNNAAPEDVDAFDYYTLDFGDIDPANAKLVIDGWSVYGGRFKTTLPKTQPYVEVVDGAGEWVKVKSFGVPAGDLKRMVIDISGLFLSDDHRVRVHTGADSGLAWRVDRLLIDDSEPVPVTVTTLDASYADLHHKGQAPYTFSDFNHRITAEDGVVPDDPAAYGYGKFTRYGDVITLLDTTDDMYAIIRHGDEIGIEFAGGGLPPLEPGMARGLILKADVYYKTFRVDHNVEPLPFHDMSIYPYDPAVENYPDDAEHNQYLLEYNTREYIE